MADVAGLLAAVVDQFESGCVMGLYQYGSSVASQLRPSSDLDFLLVTRRSLNLAERRELLRFLQAHSGSRTTLMPGRPVELTSVVHGDVVPWRYPPRCDFLYGEWLRGELAGDGLPVPHWSPDLAVLITTLLQHSRVIRGARPASALRPVPGTDLRRAINDSVPDLLGNWAGDERNVLLTLARMVVTVEAGEIVSKDEAAGRVLPSVPVVWQPLLSMAAAAYVGELQDDWAERPDARRLAELLAGRVLAGLRQ